MKIENIEWFKYKFPTKLDFQILTEKIDIDVTWVQASFFYDEQENYCCDLLWYDVEEPDYFKPFNINPPTSDYKIKVNDWTWIPE